MVNTGATGVSGATQATSDIPPIDCKELNSRNEKERAALGSDESKSIQSAFGDGGATTVAHASLNGGSPVGAASRLLPLRYKHLAEGLWANTTKAQRRQMRKTGRSNVCPGAPFNYGKACRPHQSHCESKILETLFSATPTPSGTLLPQHQLAVAGQSEQQIAVPGLQEVAVPCAGVLQLEHRVVPEGLQEGRPASAMLTNPSSGVSA